jgi:hypothetical protein
LVVVVSLIFALVFVLIITATSVLVFANILHILVFILFL